MQRVPIAIGYQWRIQETGSEARKIWGYTHFRCSKTRILIE